MDFGYTDDQQLLMTAFEGMLDRYREPPQGVHGYSAHSEDLQTEITEAGFLEIATQPGFGTLEAALMIEAAAACPVGVEAAASMLIGPLVGHNQGVLALAWQVGQPARYLAQAKRLCLFDHDAVLLATPQEGDWEAVDGVAAYPMARLVRIPDDAERLPDDAGEAVRRRAVLGIAIEAAGLMRGAIDCTVKYVKERQQFGQPLGHFQAVQHRLAEDAQLVRACRWLALRAADSDNEADAATACLYAQQAMRKVITDCHQFVGAMGLTLEFPLHLWTYRLKILQGEAGGMPQQAQRVAQAVWSAKAKAEGILPTMQIAV